MKYLRFFLLLFLVTLTFSQDTLRTLPNNAFSYGERLSFEIGYGFITAAEAFMNISPSPVIINGRETYEVNFDVNSRSSFEIIYKVRDNYKTYVDSKGLFPWKFEQHIREQNYKRDMDAYFLPDSLKVNTVVNYTERRTFEAPAYVQDIFSALYYIRTLDLKNKRDGEVITVETFNDDKHFPLTVRIIGREEVDVSAGEFKTIIVKPELQEGFTSKTSDIYVYLSDDDRKIPVKVKMKIVIGALTGELTGYSGLNGPLDAKIGE
ncbi:MAG TPA: DUF3108 domain-containing protein [Ignavibacteria bacterium]|nr:DUF3108 domain-containing protein [Ignavibacteria bacterium]